MEVQYNKQKKAYDNTVMNLETEKTKLYADIDKLWGEYKSEETKYHYMNIQNTIYESIKSKLMMENSFLKKPDAKMSDDFKSYNELYVTKIKNQEEMLVDLKKHQRYVRDNFDNNTLQVELFNNLQRILDVRKRTLYQSGADHEIGYVDEDAGGFDRLVVRE